MGRVDRRSEDGAIAVEYAILAGFIAAVVAGTVFAIGRIVVGLFAGVPPL